MSTPDIGSLDLAGSDDEDLFASPSKASNLNQKPDTKADNSNAPQRNESKYDAEQARDATLRQELDGVRNINAVIEGVVSSLECAKGNMDTVSRTVTSASTLLNTWIRILSQTEHNQRLILNPNWKGASADVADMENETVLKAQAAERRAAEEERRREEARRRAEDDERQRQATGTVRGARGRGRPRASSGYGRGSVGGSSGYGGSGYVAGAIARGPSQTGRSSTGIGRGFGSTRGRGRGVR